AEDVAAGCLVELLQRMAPVRRQEAGRLEEMVEDSQYTGGYAIRVDGRQHLIYTAAEYEHPWGPAMRRTVELVNQLLTEAGSPERCYAINSGANDGRVILLTPLMFEILRRELSGGQMRWDQPHT